MLQGRPGDREARLRDGPEGQSSGSRRGEHPGRIGRRDRSPGGGGRKAIPDAPAAAVAPGPEVHASMPLRGRRPSSMKRFVALSAGPCRGVEQSGRLPSGAEGVRQGGRGVRTSHPRRTRACFMAYTNLADVCEERGDLRRRGRRRSNGSCRSGPSGSGPRVRRPGASLFPAASVRLRRSSILTEPWNWPAATRSRCRSCP